MSTDDPAGRAAARLAERMGAEVVPVGEGAWSVDRPVDVALGRFDDVYRRAALARLAPGGRLVELGPADGDDGVVPRAALDRNLCLRVLDARRLLTDDPSRVAQLVERAARLLDEGVLAPAPVRELDAHELRAAFDASGPDAVVLRLDGPAPLRPAARPVPRPEATYLITGGLGGFGLEIARWLADHGARHLVLASRRGPETPGAAGIVADLASRGARALPVACDVSDREALPRMLAEVQRTLPPLRGVVHSAMVLDDGILEDLDAGRLERVMAPKALGALRLHEATLSAELDFFVCFSSISSLFGNMGQGSYVAANTVLDALAHHRRSLGLPATTINWGALGGTGVVARDAALEQHLRGIGVQPIDPSRAAAAFGRLAVTGPAQVGVAVVDWNRLARASATHARSPRLERLVDAPDDRATSWIERLRAAPDRLSATLAFLTERLADLLAMKPDRIEPGMKLDQLGLDSLTAVELTHAIRVGTGVAISAMSIVQGPTIRELATTLVAAIEAEDGVA